MTSGLNKGPKKPVLRVTVHRAGRLCFSSSFTQDSVLIGRHPDAEIILDAKHVSRKHAVLFVRTDTIRIEDLGSMNGTQVNGQAIKQQYLASDDKVSIGDFELSFVLKTVEQKPGLDPLSLFEMDQDAENTLECKPSRRALLKDETTKVTKAPERRRKSHYPPKAG